MTSEAFSLTMISMKQIEMIVREEFFIEREDVSNTGFR